MGAQRGRLPSRLSGRFRLFLPAERRQPARPSPVESRHSSGAKSGTRQSRSSPLSLTDGDSPSSNACTRGPNLISNTIAGNPFSPSASRTARSASKRAHKEQRGKTPKSKRKRRTPQLPANDEPAQVTEQDRCRRRRLCPGRTVSGSGSAQFPRSRRRRSEPQSPPSRSASNVTGRTPPSPRAPSGAPNNPTIAKRSPCRLLLEMRQGLSS